MEAESLRVQYAAHLRKGLDLEVVWTVVIALLAAGILLQIGIDLRTVREGQPITNWFDQAFVPLVLLPLSLYMRFFDTPRRRRALAALEGEPAAVAEA